MDYWGKDDFEAVKKVAESAASEPEWAAYAEFCKKYEHGLRREAFDALDRFIVSMSAAPFSARRRFVSWLSQQADGSAARNRLIPHPLWVRVVEPTLLEWTLVEPESYEPHVWLGGYEHLQRAQQLAPENDLVNRKSIAAILSRVDWHTHELPAGYLGVPREDLAELDQAESLLPRLSSENERTRLAVDIAAQRRLIEEYLRTR